MFTRSYELLNGLLRGGAAEALYEVLVAALEAVRRLMGRHDGAAERAAGPLCSAARVLLSKLQARAGVVAVGRWRRRRKGGEVRRCGGGLVCRSWDGNTRGRGVFLSPFPAA